MKELLKALSNVKKEVGKLSKTETNPFFKSKYFDINSLIEQVEPLLDKNGLLLLQPILNGVVTSEIWHVETGLKVSSEINLGNILDPQKLGSAITYYRRYTLQSLLGLQAEDDDGNKASQPTKPQLTNIQRMNNCKTLAELQSVFVSIKGATQAEVELKDKLKLTLK
jgi:hypothetical protein